MHLSGKIVSMHDQVAVLQFYVERIGKLTNLITTTQFLSAYGAKSKSKKNEYYVAAIYNPPNPTYLEPDLLDYLSDCCEQILISDPGARIIIAGDVNHLRISEFSRQHNLEQLVKKPTRGQNTLDVFLTNYSHIWKSPTMFISLVRSDHLAIMVSPQTLAKAERENVFIRDVREHRKIEMDKRLKEYNWADVNNANDVNEVVCTLSNVIGNMFNDCFPLIKVRVSSKDPPFMTPLVKHLCKIRNRQIGRGINPEVQEKINKLIRENQISAVRGENRKFKRGTKEWWRTVNKITGRKTNNDKVSSVINPGRINEFFQMIYTDTQYTTPIPVIIPDGTRVPIVDENDVRNIMMNLKRTGSGPDGLPYWL